MTPEELSRILQISVSPVVLISGIGLLLLSMTNRLGRVVDRSRLLSKEAPDPNEDPHLRGVQIRILWRRARLLTYSIAMAASSILFVALLIVSLFVGYMLETDVAALIQACFLLTLLLLVGSLILFIMDISLTLKALWLEIRHHVE